MSRNDILKDAKKMTDREIAEMQRGCAKGLCSECEMKGDDNCSVTLRHAAADCIERLTAEVERYKRIAELRGKTIFALCHKIGTRNRKVARMHEVIDVAYKDYNRMRNQCRARREYAKQLTTMLEHERQAHNHTLCIVEKRNSDVERLTRERNAAVQDIAVKEDKPQ